MQRGRETCRRRDEGKAAEETAVGSAGIGEGEAAAAAGRGGVWDEGEEAGAGGGGHGRLPLCMGMCAPKESMRGTFRIRPLLLSFSLRTIGSFFSFFFFELNKCIKFYFGENI